MNKRVNWYDFKRVTANDMQAEQAAWQGAASNAQLSSAGSGVLKAAGVEPVLFDSDALSTTQNSWVVAGAFDGRGIFESAYTATDTAEGMQIAIELSDSGANETIPFICTILGTDFEDNLQYEHIRAPQNGTYCSYKHYKTVQNLMVQNLFGNSDTRVDGYGSFSLGGRVVVSEAGSLLPQVSEFVSRNTLTPDVIFANYKLYDPIETLETVLEDALFGAYAVADLNIDVDVFENKEFTAGGSTEVIYGQKFRMRGNNIQKIQLLLALASGSTWTGSLSVGIRKLQTPENFASSSRFLPSRPIDFDPELETLAEVSLSQAEMLETGVVLGVDHSLVDFVFSETSVGQASLSRLEDGEWYCFTVRRIGSTTTGTLQLATSLYTGITGFNSLFTEEEFSGSGGGGGRISVFSSGFWSDINDRALHYTVFCDSARAAGGDFIDNGTRASARKTGTNSLNQATQIVERSDGLAGTATGTANYIVAQAVPLTSEPEVAVKTGDTINSRVHDTLALSALSFDEVEDLYATSPNMLPVAIVTDTNPRANPTITGISYYPGLFFGNTLDIMNPSSDLLNKKVVGSIITPNTANPAFRYRITAQEIVLDGYGDLDGDGQITYSDLNLASELDGYDVNLQTTGSFSSAQQIAAMAAGNISALDLLKANLNTDSEIDTLDLAALTSYITAGTAFPNGQAGFYRVRLTVEPLVDQLEYLNMDGTSILHIEQEDTSLLSTFSGPITWEITPVRIWRPSLVEVQDIRRFAISTAVEFVPSDLTESTPTAGKNNAIIPSDVYLGGVILDADGEPHPLDYERAQVELELPDGSSEKEINIFDAFVKNRMRFSDGSLVTASALAAGQVFFEVSVSSFAKNMGFSVDGYVDYSDVGDDADEAVGTYIDQSSGLLRVRAYHVVNNDVRPEVRTRIYVVVNLKRAGWKNAPRVVSDVELAALWT